MGRLRALLRERPRLADALIALLLTAFTLLGGVLNEISPDGPPSSPSWTIPVVTLLAIATFWRRTRTVAVFVLVAAVSLVFAALGINDAISLPALVMLYTVASRRPRREATFAWLAMLAIGLLLIVRSGEGLDYAAAIALSALVTVPFAIGIAVGNRRQLVAALRDRAERAEAEVEARSRLATLEERARISRELHDVLAHGLTVMIAQSEGAASVADVDPARAAEAMRTVASTGRESLAELRRLVAAERVEVGPKSSGSAAELAPLPGIADLDGLVARVRDAGLPVRLTRSGTVPDGRHDVGRAVYRVVQESLTNVLKHGGRGAQADVALTVADDALEVTVADHGGVRATGAGPAARGGAGLVGMRERVTMLGGDLDAGPSQEGSWVVRARLPLTLAGAS